MELFKRDGSLFTGTVNTDEKGRMTYTVVIPCDRCHVVGGKRVWLMGIENGRPYSRTGFECWTCGNTGIRGERQERLYTAAKLAQVNKTAATRAARKAEADRIAAEQAEAARISKDAAFRAENAEFIAKLESLDGDFWSRFLNDFLRRATAPTARQIEMVEGEVAKRVKNATSAFVGNVGDKLTLTVTVERIITLPDYGFGKSYINLLRDQAGNLLVYKGQSDIGQQDETVTLKATVKEHNVRDGVQQTVIQRPKVLEVA
jgi:hypothetical protein